MKSSVWDYVFLGATVALLLAISTVVVVLGLTAITRPLFGAYFIVADVGLFLLIYGLLSALLLRLVLAWRPGAVGVYGDDSVEFLRWKYMTVVYRLGQGALRPLTPFFLSPVVDSLFGARVGANVAIGGAIDDPYMVSIGEGSVLGNASLVSGNFIAAGKLTLGRVTLGRGVTVGANSIIFPDVEVGDGAVLISGSCVTPGTRIPAGETWRGNPARKWVTSVASNPG